MQSTSEKGHPLQAQGQTACRSPKPDVPAHVQHWKTSVVWAHISQAHPVELLQQVGDQRVGVLVLCLCTSGPPHWGIKKVKSKYPKATLPRQMAVATPLLHARKETHLNYHFAASSRACSSVLTCKREQQHKMQVGVLGREQRSVHERTIPLCLLEGMLASWCPVGYG